MQPERPALGVLHAQLEECHLASHLVPLPGRSSRYPRHATGPARQLAPVGKRAVDRPMQPLLGCRILVMYAAYIVRRTQIYLDEEQDRRLVERARATGRTKSDLIREAVDRFLDAPLTEEEELARFRAAAGAAFGIAPYLEDGVTYVRKLRENDRRRQERLEELWHGERSSR